MKHAHIKALALIFCVLLSACGGGDEEDDTKDTGPVDCRARPELCR